MCKLHVNSINCISFSGNKMATERKHKRNLIRAIVLEVRKGGKADVG
jgi:hypothetical protein